MSALQDRTILVTRPAGLEREQMRLLSTQGARPMHLPAIEITDPVDDTSRAYAREHLHEFDIAIFISPTSVDRTLDHLSIDDKAIRLCAIGSRSQRALEEAGHDVMIQPQGHDSESLLHHELLQQEFIDGKNIVIFRGEDGRDVLADNLRRRGAEVFYAAMYSRRRPPGAVMTGDALAGIDAMTISSNEGLRNIFEMAVESHCTERLLMTPLFVPGERANRLANELGFETVIQADNATDAAMLSALQEYFTDRD